MGMYYTGLRGEKNLQLRIDLLKRSADQNFAPAQQKLGGVYYEGIWIKQNLPLARELLIKSALQGHAPAQYELGVMLIKGLGGGEFAFRNGAAEKISRSR